MIIPRGPETIRNRQTTSGRMESTETQKSISLASSALGFAQKYLQEKDETQFQEAINNTLKKKNEWKAKNLTREGKDAEGLTEDFIAFNKELEEEISPNLSTNAREKFNQWNARDAEQEKFGVMLHQRKQDQFVKQSAFNEGLTIAEEGIRQDAKGNRFKAFEHADLTLQNGLNAGVIAPEQYETKRTEVMNRLRTETAKSYYMQDKHDFMKTGINDLGLGEPEKAYWKERYGNDLRADEREKKSLNAESAAILWSKKDDMAAQAIANEDTTHFGEAALKMDAMGYPKYAEELREQKTLYDKTIGFRAEHKNAPLKEVYQAAMSREVPTDLEGSGIEFKANQTIQKEVGKMVKQFQDDPAQYVTPFVVGDNQEEIASSRLSLQKNQGFMPKDGYQILTKQEKNTYKATWETGDIKQRTDLLKGSFEYGKHSSKVIKEAGLNSTLSLAPMLAQNDRDIELLVAGVSADKNPLAADLDESTKSDYTREAKSSKVYQVLAKTQAYAPTNEGLNKGLVDMQNAIVGVSSLKGDKNFGREFFDSKLKVLDDDDKNVYFPSNIDEDAMEDALNNRKNEFIKTMPKSRIRDAVWVNTQTGMTLLDTRLGLPVPGTEFEFNKVDDIMGNSRELSRIRREEFSAKSKKNLTVQD